MSTRRTDENDVVLVGGLTAIFAIDSILCKVAPLHFDKINQSTKRKMSIKKIWVFHYKV